MTAAEPIAERCPSLPAHPADQVALGGRLLADNGQEDMIWGHVSVRDPTGDGSFWIKSAGFGFAEADRTRVVRLSRIGELVEGTGRAHLEHPIHGEILAARPDVGSVVHTHAEAAIAFSATSSPLEAVGHEGTLFVPPDVARFTVTGDLVRDASLGAALAAALGDRNAILLPRHGLVTVGPDLPSAVLAALFLEKACRAHLAVAAAAGFVPPSPEAEALAKRDRCYGAGQRIAAWEYLVRQLAAQ